MGRIKDENFYQIQGWMLNRLNLKGIDLQIFAIIYGFSQDDETEFTGSIGYLSEFTGTSRPTVIKSLKKLCENQYIMKKENKINGVCFNTYKTLLGVKNFNWGSKETLLGGSKETLPNNNILNNNKYIKESKKEKTKPQNSFDEIFKDYTQNEETLRLLGEWLKVRKSKRAAMTDYSIKLNLNKLDKLAKQSDMSVNNYLKEVIARGWQAFYPVKSYATDNNGQLNETYSKYRRL